MRMIERIIPVVEKVIPVWMRFENVAAAKVAVTKERMAKRARDLVEFGPNLAKWFVGAGTWYGRGNQRVFEVAFGTR